mmetsp:Transcript_5470/g.15231  ORF Transcript_5470/g.15231 Transcript_5470/m.15231 type:complete len:233 (-) Transcript_5470:1273-1971(-)
MLKGGCMGAVARWPSWWHLPLPFARQLTSRSRCSTTHSQSCSRRRPWTAHPHHLHHPLRPPHHQRRRSPPCASVSPCPSSPAAFASSSCVASFRVGPASARSSPAGRQRSPADSTADRWGTSAPQRVAGGPHGGASAGASADRSHSTMTRGRSPGAAAGGMACRGGIARRLAVCDGARGPCGMRRDGEGAAAAAARAASVSVTMTATGEAAALMGVRDDRSRDHGRLGEGEE